MGLGKLQVELRSPPPPKARPVGETTALTASTSPGRVAEGLHVRSGSLGVPPWVRSTPNKERLKKNLIQLISVVITQHQWGKGGHLRPSLLILGDQGPVYKLHLFSIPILLARTASGCAAVKMGSIGPSFELPIQESGQHFLYFTQSWWSTMSHGMLWCENPMI